MTCAAAAGARPDDLQYVRIRSQKHEILIAPEFEAGREYTLVVVHQTVTA